MKPILKILFLICISSLNANAQIDPDLLKTVTTDSIPKSLNMDAVYRRPFLNLGKFPVAVGGYAEVNWQHLASDGISEGHQFQMRRLTLFVASSISKRIKFLSEIEFEEGGKEIAIEFASVDIEMHPLFNLRSGIIMNPIGAFNQNHDGPKWEFTDRPISATQMLPATWSNAGFGIFGKTFKDAWMFGYEVYLSGGFDNSIIDNEHSKTFLPSSKNNPERFEEAASGTPLITAKVGAKQNKLGEIGLSYMGGIYNTFQEDGLVIDSKRKCHVIAIDYNKTFTKLHTFITGEWAWIFVDIPLNYTQQYGRKQYGGFLDIVQPIFKREIFGWEDAQVNIACRLEYVDWNVGKFNENGMNIGDELISIMPAVSFRPSAQTVLRVNYRYQFQYDLFGNPPAKTAGFSFGLSSYF